MDSQLFESIANWWFDCSQIPGYTIPWEPSHLAVFYNYILKLRTTNYEFRPLGGFHPRFSRDLVASFMQEFQEFFTVPKLDKSCVKNNTYTLDKKEVLAAFIHFLLQLLSQKTEFVHPFEDRIGHLKKELRFLAIILGDRPLLCDEVEQVKNLLAKIESVANIAGSFVYSFIFDRDGVFVATRMDDTLVALFRYIDQLRGDIINLPRVLPPLLPHTPEIAAVDSLLHDLKDLMNQEHNLIVEVKDEIKELRQHLMLSQSVLKGIKVPPHLDIKELKSLVTQIRDLAYDAEYLVNSFLAGHVPCEYLSVRLRDIIHKIKIVGIELQEINKNYNIMVSKVAEDLNAQLSSQAQRNLDEDAINIMVGSEDRANHVLGLLVGGTRDLQIIVIFGMPGLGKTTLAKKLCNHPKINDHFDRCSFIVVSQTYQRKNLLIDILISLGINKVEISDMGEEHLAECIHKSLKGRRYFIVMDDVWDSNMWDNLTRYFPDDGNGSRILFTSRNKDVAPPDSIIYELPSMSNDECWELLQKKVFENKPCPLQLIGIGKKIAKNCNGLPLTVVVIAGVLSTINKEESAWKNVGTSLASYILSDTSNPTMQILKLSYTHLPDHLKPCFLYFGIFPEDKEILVKKLKCLWIAERFINNEGMLKNDDSLAEDYLMELIDRSLVMIAKRGSTGRAKTCIIHDLLHELCLRIAEEENFLMVTESEHLVYTRHHRLKVSRQHFPPFGFHLRSLFISDFWDGDKPWTFDSGDPLTWDFRNLNLLMVLDLGESWMGIDINEHLAHLRYLVTRFLPEPKSSFTNLEYLIVIEDDGDFVYISSIIQKSVKLKYLRVPRARFDENCNSYQTNNLEYLATVIIYKRDEKMLECSPHLRKLKCEFENSVDEDGNSHYPDLRFLTHLDSLSVTIRRNLGFGEEINFPSNITKLNFFSKFLPNEMMSIIGRLPKLEVLKLGYFRNVGKILRDVGEIWDTRDGEFQQLRFLRLHNIKFTQWNVASSEHFPRLEQLILWYCSDLQKIPSEIGEITTLQLIEVDSCKKSIVESATKIKQEQEEMGNEELNVIIKGTQDL